MADSEQIKEINLEHGEEAKVADKEPNSNHNKDASNGKKKGNKKINDMTKGQNSTTYHNNQCNGINGSVYGGSGGTFNFGWSKEKGEETKATHEGPNSNHNKYPSNGKKKGDKKINDTTKGQNSTTYNNNGCSGISGSVEECTSTFNFGLK